jgi:hypothetical protein
MCGFVGVYICTTLLHLSHEQFISHATLVVARNRQKVMTTGKALPAGAMREACARLIGETLRYTYRNYKKYLHRIESYLAENISQTTGTFIIETLIQLMCLCQD